MNKKKRIYFVEKKRRAKIFEQVRQECKLLSCLTWLVCRVWTIGCKKQGGRLKEG